jgi:hypothetical protein
MEYGDSKGWKITKKKIERRPPATVILKTVSPKVNANKKNSHNVRVYIF